MATRGLIGTIYGDILTLSSNHYDSYPEHLGVILDKFYSDSESAKTISHSGEIRGVDEETGEIEMFPDSKGKTQIDLLDEDDPNYVVDKIYILMEMKGAQYLYIYNDSNSKWDMIEKRGYQTTTDHLKDVLFSSFTNKEDQIDYTELEEQFVNKMKFRAGIIK
jgi:hypothetical protein